MVASKSTKLVLQVAVAFYCPIAALADIDFASDIAPIFQKRCLSCHNDTESSGHFSIESASVLTSGYIEKGNSESSHLVELISSTDDAVRMPKNADRLSPQETRLIRQWIDEGAVWPKTFRIQEAKVTNFDWWSYGSIVKPAVPTVKSDWVRSPIDAFVFKSLQRRKLTPAAEADRRTLIRRLTFDLTGLPPSPEEVDAFVSDESPDAYENLVDQLLESPHYGERWARHWLDVVKYADTCGYDKDKLRPNAWPYRDYVIRAFNDDKPYSRFIQEQVAGDVLFAGEPDGILGLGFIAAGPWDFIGHVEVPESKIDGMVARNLDRDDMVSNVFNTFCSVTIQCARCHNHKFDPITQEHYYGLQAIFSAVDKADRIYNADPATEKKRSSLNSQLADLRAKKAAIASQITALGGHKLADVNKRISSLRNQQQVEKPPEFGFHSSISATADGEKWAEVSLKQSQAITHIVIHPCHDDYAGIGAGFGFPVRFRIDVKGVGAWTTIADHTTSDFPNPALTPVTFTLPANAKAKQPIRKIRITATKLAKRNNDFIFAIAELEAFGTDGTNQAISSAGAIVTSSDSIEAPVRWRRSNLIDGKWARFSNPDVARQLLEASTQHDSIMNGDAIKKRVSEQAEIEKAIKTVQREIKSLPRGQLVYAAATEFKTQGHFKPTSGKRRPVRVLHRGNVQQPRDIATPGLLPFAPSTSWKLQPATDESEHRAQLAEWLTSNNHPLVWRSIVNRIWQYHFGRGIVSTPNDFGRMGAKPTHPKLLDWLAAEFRDGGQSFKQLHRLIVCSSVYRQASTHNARNAEIDSSNQYLWRMNRRRLAAEEIRDSILSVSDSLDKTMGGPGFYLFALEKTEHSPHFEYHKFDPNNAASHRRSVYRFIARSQPNPWMTTLDCADSSQSTPKRNETLTSLQALSLLNNRFNLVMSERFAQRLESEADELSNQIQRAFQLIVQRSPTTEELKMSQAYAHDHGLKNLARMLFNLSEFVFID